MDRRHHSGGMYLLTDGDDYHCPDCGESFDEAEVTLPDGTWQCPLCYGTDIEGPN